MKKNIAISVLLIFFLAQFGRVINFCLCSMAAYQQTKTFTCDCERQLFTAIKTDNTSKDQSPQNIYSHVPSEELFHPTNFSILPDNHTICFTAWPKTGNEALYHIFEKNIFHPPPGVA